MAGGCYKSACCQVPAVILLLVYPRNVTFYEIFFFLQRTLCNGLSLQLSLQAYRERHIIFSKLQFCLAEISYPGNSNYCRVEWTDFFTEPWKGGHLIQYIWVTASRVEFSRNCNIPPLFLYELVNKNVFFLFCVVLLSFSNWLLRPHWLGKVIKNACVIIW
jgi:hypothetical protein